MESGVKIRDARFCNLKLLLIYLVVYGHLIETRINDSAVLLWQYRIIYMFHMPLFIFLSGYFLKTEKSCLKQLKKSGLFYALAQLAAMFVCFVFLNQQYSFFKPYWHLWYLFSLTIWSGLGLLLHFMFRKYPFLNKVWVKILLLLAAILAGCLVGGCPQIGRFLSLSRTIVFLPYFLAGVFFPKNWNFYRTRPANRITGIAALSAAAILIFAFGRQLTTSFLFQAGAFGKMGFEKGVWLRLLCYAIGTLLSLFLLTVIPAKKLAFSRAGANTCGIYLLHVIPAILLRDISVPAPAVIICAPLIGIAIVWMLHKVFQWQKSIYYHIIDTHPSLFQPKILLDKEILRIQKGEVDEHNYRYKNRT